MEYPAVWLYTLLFIGCTYLISGQENAQTRIPESLIDCYRNQSLRHPENRPPMTIESFIHLVRKIENFQRDSMDMTALTIAMLHRFRLDGIERSQDVVETEGVIPYAVSGYQFFKHRLVLRYLVPSNNYQFPNESLTQIEKCTLHFMLSHSIERTQRNDESTVCNRLSNYESSRSSRVPRFAKLRRQIEQEEANAQNSEETTLNSKEEVPGSASEVVASNAEETTNQNSADEDTSKQISDDSHQEEKDTDEPSQEDEKSDNTTKKEDDVELVGNQTTISNETKGNFIFDDNIETNKFPEHKSRRVVISSTTVRPAKAIDAQKPVPRATITVTESDCPVENGVVKTDWGSVSLGTVLTGIAAGLFPQSIQVQNLVQGGPRSKTLSALLGSSLVDNKFAVTLTGDLAEVALVQGPRKLNDLKVGTPGGWNSTLYPRWYFDNEKEDNEMTDAEIRGGLDGLIMGTYAQKWKQSVSGGGLRLSELLTMYYSEDGVFSSTYRACQRRDAYSEVAPNTVMQDQAYWFAIVLDQQAITSASVDDTRVRTFAETAVSKLTTYLPAMNDNPCSTKQGTPRSATNTSVTSYTNVTVVIDRSWAYKDMKNILYYLMKKLEVEERGSLVTVLDGKNRAPFLVDMKYLLDMETNFTESAYLTHETGMDIPKALEQELQKNMEDLLTAESENNVAGGRSTVILFIPKDVVNLNNNDLTIARDKIRHFRQFLPDVKFLYLAPGNKDNYKELVDNIISDVFTISYQGTENEIPRLIDPVVDRINEVPLRLMNPTCGADWKSESYNTAEFVHSVKPGGVNYHRLHPNYFYGVGSAEITVIGSGASDLKVCFARKTNYPAENATSDATCSQTSSGEVVIKLENPCADIGMISQCRPLYISVTSIARVEQYSCTDCRLPHYVKYTIRNKGLDCKAGVGRFLSSPYLIMFATTIMLLLRNLSVGS